MTGAITTLFLDKGYAFIAAEDGQDYFMHVRNIDASLEWDEQLQGRRVVFEAERHASHKRPRAVNIRPAE